MAATSTEEIADYVDEEQEEYDEDEAGQDQGEEENEDLKDDEDVMKRRVLEMEDELNKLQKMQEQTDRQIHSALDSLDEKSIYVGQVDYEATPEDLKAHFSPCGTINRITIMVDKLSGKPKGFAYIEFVDKEAVDNALKLDDTPFKGRQLKVTPKRKNIPAARGGRGGRGGRGAFPGGRFASRGGGRFGGGGGGGGRFFGGRGAYRGGGRGGRSFGRGAYHSSYY